jgi:hypothetical protein
VAETAKVHTQGCIHGWRGGTAACNQRAAVWQLLNGCSLARLQDFARIFSELYPQRRPLYLLPPNECGMPKLVCSTLRPTQLPCTELYDLPTAAQFVADFVTYEPLEDPAVGGGPVGGWMGCVQRAACVRGGETVVCASA